MLTRENFTFKSSEMAINASKTASGIMNLQEPIKFDGLLEFVIITSALRIKQQVTTWSPR